IGEMLEREESAWNDWLSYILLRQPGGSFFVIDGGIETRQRHATTAREDGPFAEKIPLARAFATTKEERSANVTKRRELLKEKWGGDLPRFEDEERNSAFSPYIVLHRGHPDWYPTDAQRAAAVAMLPYVARDRFIHQRVDSRKPAVFTFVRRPAYYAAFATGPQITPQQRLGLGIVWSPTTGAVLQS